MMLAKIGEKKVLKSKEYIFEPKLDGYRAICKVENENIKLISRNGLDITSKFKELEFKVKKNCVLDGELIIYDDDGNPSFSLMQKNIGKANYVIFDVLEVENEKIKKFDLSKRKKILNEIVKETKNVQIIPTTNDGETLWTVMLSRNLEGVIAKKKESKYVDGRSSNWLKIKNILTIDCIIIGYLTKIRTIASLALALYDKKELKYIGQVGTGFKERFLNELIEILKTKKNNGNKVKLPKNVIPIKPELVCEVKYLMFTDDGKLRAPVFIKLREDKLPTECTFEQVKNA